MKTRLPGFSTLAAVLAAVALSVPSAGAAGRHAAVQAVYVAHLAPLNVAVVGGKTTGEARFVIRGDELIIDIKVSGAPPDITHWQHFHGFKDGSPASCPTPSADKNGDGIIDLLETGPASGTTMVPFDDAPARMDVAHGVYPKAGGDGSYSYHKVVSLKALRAALAKTFGSRRIDLDKRVVYIHGVPASARLPSTVASLGPIPARVTLPIACGRIELVHR